MMDEGKINKMAEMNERKDKLNIRFAAIVLLLLLSAAILIWIKVAGQSENVWFNSEKACVLDGEWQLSCGNVSESMALPAEIDAKADDVISLTRTLHKEDITGNSMMFYARQAWVEISIDGEILQASDEERHIPFDMTPGSYWHFFRLPEDFDGKTLVIQLKPSIDRYAGELPTIYTGTKTSFVYMLLENAKSTMLLMGAVLIMGVAMLIFGISVAKSLMGKRLIGMGLFAMSYSTWLFLESRITQIFTGDMVAASYLLFTCYFMMPVLACSFLLTFESIAKSKTMNVLFWISAVMVVVVHLLQITEVFYYIEMVPVVHVVLILIILEMLVTYIRLRIRSVAVKDKSIYRALVLFGICCTVDIFQFYFTPEAIIGTFSKAGILLFFGYLGYVAIRNFGRIEIQEAENRIYKKMAYCDMLTGIANRTAFEEALAEYEDAPWEEETFLLMIDMNRLKYINDNYGHAKGDQALRKIAELMTQQFEEGCRCFRIGGDEFCVISRGVSEEKFSQNCDEFTRKVGEFYLTDGLQLSVSCGYCAVDEAGMEACYKKADAIMYEAKVASKMQRID